MVKFLTCGGVLTKNYCNIIQAFRAQVVTKFIFVINEAIMSVMVSLPMKNNLQ